MLNIASNNSDKLSVSNSRLVQLGCFYVVSVKKGGRFITSAPQTSVEKAVEDFEFKYNLLTF